MPRATRFTDSLDSRIPAIARRIRNRMKRLGLNDQLLAEECNRKALEVLSPSASLKMSRERVAKILMNCKKNPERSAARIISYSELLVLSAALAVSAEWLVGQRDNCDPVHWNVLAEPERARHLLHLLSEYEEKAGELLVWADFLMCSLVTPELMHASHMARYAELDLIGLGGEKEKAVALFDGIGSHRRRRLLRNVSERGYSYRQIIFYSDLKAVSEGAGEYERIDAALRGESLKYLAGLIEDETLGIDLIVVRDEEARDIRRALRDYDSMSVFGSEFTLWGYHSGSVAWSEHRSYIASHRKIFDRLQALAMSHRGAEVSGMLRDLSEWSR